MAVRGGIEIGKLNSVIKSHTATGSSLTFYPATDMRGSSGGLFNFEVHGTFVGTILVEKTFDDGTTWFAANDTLGNAGSKTAAGQQTFREFEQGVGYRTRCSAYTSGTAVSRLSQ